MNANNPLADKCTGLMNKFEHVWGAEGLRMVRSKLHKFEHVWVGDPVW